MTITVLSIHDAKAKSALADELERQILHLNARGGCSDDKLSLGARELERCSEGNRNGAADGRTRRADGVERVLDKVVRGCGRHRGACGGSGLVSHLILSSSLIGPLKDRLSPSSRST